jgi:mono/diheme cytochrome c family protein
MVDEGQDLFGTVCAACHGPNGTGTPAAPTLNDMQWINITGTYPEIETTILHGVPAPKEHPGSMPPRGGGSFNDTQVKALAAYVFALSHQGAS